MAEYWWNEDLGEIGDCGHLLELRGQLAIKFVEHWGMVAGHVKREDSGNRAVLDVMPVEEVIERATTMADGLVAALEQRGWIKLSTKTPEEQAAQVGRLTKIRHDAEYERSERTRELEEQALAAIRQRKQELMATKSSG